MEKKSNKGLIITLVLFILISIALGGYIVYDKGYLDSLLGKEKVVEPKEEKEESKEVEKLSLDDKVIQDLYAKIKSKNAYDQVLISQVLENKKELITKDLDSNILNYYGYRNLKVSQLEKDICRNYPSILAKSSYLCNDNNNVEVGVDTTTNSTNVFAEEDLKESVEEIFGKNSYQKTESIEVSFDEYYIYDSTSKKYVDTYIVGGGTDITYEKELIDLDQKEDSLSLIESVKFEDSIDEKISYNYRLDNGEYYLYSISLVK